MKVNQLTIPTKLASWQRWKLPLLSVTVVSMLSYLASLSWQQLQFSNKVVSQQAWVELGDVTAQISAHGRLLPRQHSSLIAEVDGTIVEILLFPGSEVKTGTPLLKLRNPLLERELERAELALLEARAVIESTQAKQQREAIALENEVAMVRSEIKLAEQEMLTLQVLLQQQVLARLDYLRAETKLQQAKMRLNVGISNLQAFQQAQGADQRAAEYRYQQAAKLFAIAEHDLAQLTVVADRDGLLTMLSEHAEVGKPVRKGEVLAQITDPSTVYADVRVSAHDAARLSLAQSAEVTIRGQAVTAKVLRIYPTAEQNQVRVELELTGDVPESARPNLDVAAKITTDAIGQVLRVKPPLQITQSGPATVYVASQQDFIKRQIEVGVIGHEQMEVRSGLSQGDRILLDVPKELQGQDVIYSGELNLERINPIKSAK